MDIYPGRYAMATAGREKDRVYVIVSLDTIFAYIANGKERKIDKPKKKKLKHLNILSFQDEYINQKLTTGQKVSNSEIRKSLKRFEQRSLL